MKINKITNFNLSQAVSHGASGHHRTSLLSTVGQILASHGQYKRSPDAHFKAFVCAGLK